MWGSQVAEGGVEFRAHLFFSSAQLRVCQPQLFFLHSGASTLSRSSKYERDCAHKRVREWERRLLLQSVELGPRGGEGEFSGMNPLVNVAGVRRSRRGNSEF